MSPLERFRIHQQPVPVIAPPPTRRRLKEILFRAGVRVRLLGSPEEASELPWDAFPVFVEFIEHASDTGESPNLAALDTIERNGADCRAVVVCDDSTPRGVAADLLSIDRSATPVLMLPSDARSVVRTLDRCRVRNWSIDRERRIDAATQLPRLARDALIWNVRLAVGTAESDLVGKGMLDAVAEGVGSPKRKIEYLNLSRGLHLQEIYDRSRTLLIHASHDIDGVSLKKLVRTAGFDTPSGVTHLFRRVHGMPPREVIDAGLDPSIWKLDEILEEVLSGRR